MGRSYRLRENKSGALEMKTQATKPSSRRRPTTAQATTRTPPNHIEDGAHENVTVAGMIISPTETKANVKSQERTPTPTEQRMDVSGEQHIGYAEVKQPYTDMNSNSIQDEENGSQNMRSITKSETGQKTTDMNSNRLLRSPAGRHLLKQLQTTLSPKLSEVSMNEDRRVSRYGRHQKQKENINYVPVDLMRYVTNSPSKVKQKKDSPVLLKGEMGPELLNHGIGMADATEVKGLENNSTHMELENISPTLLESPSIQASVLKNETDDVLDMDAINIIQMNASFENINDEAILSGNTPHDTTSSVGPNLSLEADSLNESSAELTVGYRVGQIYWGAQTQRTVHWPCLVRADPETNQTTRMRREGSTEIHVAYFGDRGRRQWIREAYMVPFNDVESYCNSVENGEFGKFVKASSGRTIMRQKWKQASALAEKFCTIDIDQRLQQFDTEVKLERLRDASNRLAKGAQTRTEKRNRSISPESPPYDAIPLNNVTKKMRLLSSSTEEAETVSPGLPDTSPSGSEGRRAASDEAGRHGNTSPRENYTELVYKLIVNIGLKFLLNDPTTNERAAALLKQYARKISLLKTDRGDQQQQQSKRTTVLRDLYQLRQLGQMVDEFMGEKHGGDGGESAAMKMKKEKKSLEEEFIFEHDPKTIMKGVPKGFVCSICERPQNVVKCGKCQRHVHLSCVTADIVEQLKLQTMVDEKRFNCNECAEAEAKDEPKCFVCNDESEEAKSTPKLRCTSSLCSRHYHLSCLRCFPQFATRDSQSIICPYHVCHTCVSDDPRGTASTVKATLVRCIKCPSAYHPDMDCIPAGSEILTTHELICPKHSLDQTALNVNWCFLCCQGGDLVCCETCPNAFHRDCLQCAIPEGKYFCEECESGRLPLYNEIVIAKLGSYRWWPGLIVPPSEISENLLKQRPSASSICVKFFQSRTVAWLNRRRMYLYQHDDSENLGAKKTGSLDKYYRIAMEEASNIYQKLQAIKGSQNGQLVRKSTVQPPVYKKIKSNQYIAPLKHPQSSSAVDSNCYCRPEDDDPCGPTSSCINRAIMIECIPKTCPAKDRCSNQRFSKRLYPALEVKHFAEKGYGLVAKEPIHSGQFIVEYVGEVINTDEFQRRNKMLQELQMNNYYFLTVEPDMTIDASAKGNVSRFINHSCEPNCETQKWSIGKTRVIGLFAIRDIQRGEELTFNYNLESLGNKKRVCLCGAAKCSGFLGAKYRPAIEMSTAVRNRTKSATKKTKKRTKIQQKKKGNTMNDDVKLIDDGLVTIEPETIDVDDPKCL